MVKNSKNNEKIEMIEPAIINGFEVLLLFSSESFLKSGEDSLSFFLFKSL